MVAGITAAMAFANEFQGDGTPHGHGFVALANAYQYNSLDAIAELLEENIHSLDPAEMVQRVTSFMEHLHREDHFDDSAHQKNIDSLEQEFHMNNFCPPQNEPLSVRPALVHRPAPNSCLWSLAGSSMGGVQEDARRFTAEYEGDVQFILSRVQHQCHKLDKHGKRQPMRYCQRIGRGSKRVCSAA